MTRRQATARALELIEAVGLPEPQTRLSSYPHQLSGGQRQRVMIAIALACDPELLIADEPTTSLDVTTQAQIIDLVRDLQRDFGTAVVWISHDLGVIGQVADDVTVLQDGEAVEQAPVLDVFDNPQQPYTRELLTARPLVGVSGPAARRLRRTRVAPRRGARCALPGDHTGRQVDRACGEGLELSDSARNDARTGRRIGFGQVDRGGRADRAGQTGRRQRLTGRNRCVRRARRRREGVAPTDQPRLPGSVLVAQSPHPRGNGDRRAAVGAPACEGQAGAPEAGGGTARTRRVAGVVRVALPARAVRRTASAGEHRPGARRRTRPADPRRIDRVAGCVGSVAGARPARASCSATCT